jgi:hypothetical protein
VAKHRYQTEIELQGPWLLESAALSELDGALDQALDRWAASYANPDVNNSVPLEVERSIDLTLKNGDKLQAATFQEAARNREIQRTVIESFKLRLRAGDADLEIEVDSDSGGDMEIESWPEDSETSKDLFDIACQWANEHRPRQWLQIWSSRWFVLWLLLIWAAYLWVVIHIVSGALEPDNTALVREARALVKTGIGQNNRDQALSLLLRLASGDNSGAVKGVSGLEILYLVCGGLFCVMIYVRPRTSIGIGSGAARVRRWKFWIRFVSVTLPLLIFSNAILPPLKRLVTQLLTK